MKITAEEIMAILYEEIDDLKRICRTGNSHEKRTAQLQLSEIDMIMKMIKAVEQYPPTPRGRGGGDVITSIEAMEYIRSHEGIYPVMVDALNKVAEIFPTEKKTLFVHHDTETDDEYLVLDVEMSEYSSDFFEKMEIIEKSYVPKLENVASGWFSVVPRFCENTK